MPTLVNNLRAIRGPVTAVPMVGQSGVVVEPDTQNNQVVVRADETVLWEGQASVTNRTTTLNLSESVYNFERIAIWDDWLNNSPTKVTEFSTAGQTGGTSFERFGTWHVSVDGYQFETNPSFYIGMNVYSVQNSGLQIRTERNFIAQIKNNTGVTMVERNSSQIYRVVGINRIANN